MKFAKIEIEQGITNSLEVLKRLKRREELKGYTISVGAFTNSREVGLTFYVSFKGDKNLDNPITFCVYEHRNSGEIIINGKSGLVCANGDLPYGDSKYDVSGAAEAGEYEKATDILVSKILKLSY